MTPERLQYILDCSTDQYNAGQEFRIFIHELIRALKELEEVPGSSYTNLQRHRDHWRGYAYGKRDKPTDFMDGNMVNRPLTKIDTLEAENAALTAKVRELIDKLDAAQARIADRQLVIDTQQVQLEMKVRDLDGLQARVTELEGIVSLLGPTATSHKGDPEKDKRLDQLLAAEARIERLARALTWVTNLLLGVSKGAGDGFHHGITDTEWQDAIQEAKDALAGAETPDAS